MILILDTIRRSIASRPLWLFLALLLVSVIARRVLRRGATGSASVTVPRAAAVAALIYYVAVAVWYGLVPEQSDYAEPTMTCVAWLFSIGKPVYHTIASADRYSHMYGPLAFIVPGIVLELFGPGMLVGKSVGVVAALSALALTWWAVRSAAPNVWVATVACGFCVLQFLMFRNLTFWSRPEPLQLAAVGAGLYAAARLTGLPAAAVISLSMGTLWNLKITGPLYSLPILALRYSRANGRLVAGSIAGAAIVAVLPFVIFPNVSWSDYILWVRLSAQNGLRVAALKENIEWALFFLVPVLVRLMVSAPVPPAMRYTIPALLLSVFGVIVAASKPGAGAYHLVPFLPTIAYVYAASVPHDRTASQLMWRTPFTATLVFIVLIQQQYFFRVTVDPQVMDSYRDVEEYLASHPGERVAVGYTSAERMTFARTLAVFETGDYLLDVPAIQEHQLSGLGLPAATIDAIRSCSVRTWLLPRVGQPFHIRNDYPSTGYVEIFPPEFITAFHEAYRLDGKTRHYDVWRCRAEGS